MERIIYRKTLDVHKNGIQFMLQGFQTADNLSRVVEISLMASGDAIDFPLERIEAMMYVTTPGATEPSINKCTIKDNKVVYEVLPIVGEGITNMQLKIMETSPEGAKRVLASPEFAVEVSKSNMDDGSAEQSTTFTALEDAVAKAKTVYDERFLRMELDSECVFKAWYADGTYYETDVLQRLFKNGNVLLSESFAKGGTGVRAGEDTDNSKYYSNVAKSEALNAQNIMENSEEILEEVKLHGVYTAFAVNFETGEAEYVSPSFKFKINIDTGDLDAIGQTYSFNDEVGRVVKEWCEANGIIFSDLQAISTTHTREISELQEITQEHSDELARLKEEDAKNLSIINELAPIPSYLVFAGNVNANMVAAAFGKGNEEDVRAVGKALAMYGNFKGETSDVSFMESYDKYSDLVKDHKVDLINTPTVWSLINGNSYAKSLVKETNVGLPDIVVYDSGNSDYLDLDNISTQFTTTDTANPNRNSCSINIENGNIRMKLNVAYTNGGSQWAGFGFPVINALPSLKGYRYLHVKLADSPASYLNMGSASNTETVDMHLTINGKQRTIFANKNNNGVYDPPGYGLSYKTGNIYTEDTFDLNLTDSTASTMQFNLAVTTGVKQEYASTWADMSVEKIWFSET